MMDREWRVAFLPPQQSGGAAARTRRRGMTGGQQRVLRKMNVVVATLLADAKVDQVAVNQRGPPIQLHVPAGNNGRLLSERLLKSKVRSTYNEHGQGNNGLFR